MKYLLLLYGRDGLPEPGTPEFQDLLDQWGTATRAMAEAGVLLDCAPLRPAAEATTVRVRDGRTLLTDGPAAEIKEHLGGYTLVDCADRDEALRWAATLPAAAEGSVQVREVVRVGA